MGYRKYELSTINMLYSLKKVGHITPLPGDNRHFFLSPRWPFWRGSTVVSFKGRGPGIVYSPFSAFTR